MTVTIWLETAPFLALIVVHAVNLGLLAYKKAQEEIDALTWMTQVEDLVDAKMERRA